jgi:hypothetical protein
VKISTTNDPLFQLQQEIDQSVDGNGVQVDTRVFHPYSMELIWRTDRSVLQIGKNCIAIGNCFGSGGNRGLNCPKLSKRKDSARCGNRYALKWTLFIQLVADCYV